MMLERDRLVHLADFADAVRFAQNANREQYSSYISALLRSAG
jgi:hypothetical protein